MKLQEWVRLPTAWIEEKGLKNFKWVLGKGANNSAGLMLLLAIAHHADENGISVLTYKQLEEKTDLSRAKISAGLIVLEEFNIIERNGLERSHIKLCNFNPVGWGKLPAKGLYKSGCIHAFKDFHLRRSEELNALKLYLLFVARRDEKNNMANISYKKINEYSGIEEGRIKSGISLLASHSLIHVEHVQSEQSERGVSNRYRLVHLEPRNHMGTRGRSSVSTDMGRDWGTDLF